MWWCGYNWVGLGEHGLKLDVCCVCIGYHVGGISEAAVDVEEVDFSKTELRMGMLGHRHSGIRGPIEFHGGDRAVIGSTGTLSDSAATGPPSLGDQGGDRKSVV